MSKYLLSFSYLGTRFSGLQKQPRNITVQGVLESALSLVLRIPDQMIKVHTSSRTDAGVHAIMNTACVTLPPENQVYYSREYGILGIPPEEPYDPDYLLAAINHVLWDLNLDIRLTGCRLVSPGFCQRRHAMRRSYLYRLAVLKPERESDHGPILLQNPSSLCPLIEKDRCWPIGANFDIGAFQAAAQEFNGEHNFASFMSKPDKDVNTMRFIKAILFEAGRPMLDERHEPRCGWFNFYDITVVSKSFLYKQIRRMMGSMVAVAQKRLKIDDIRWLLNNPHWQNSDKYKFHIAPACGLYLKEILYDPQNFDNPSPYYGRDGGPDGEEEVEEEAEESEK